MKIIKSIKYLKRIVKESKRNGSSINFIPTMGALHLGHIKLIQKAKKRNAVRIVSIFINPSQFGPSEDFKNYPRTIHNDLNLLRNEDVDIVFLPIENEIFKGFNLGAMLSVIFSFNFFRLSELQELLFVYYFMWHSLFLRSLYFRLKI